MKSYPFAWSMLSLLVGLSANSGPIAECVLKQGSYDTTGVYKATFSIFTEDEGKTFQLKGETERDGVMCGENFGPIQGSKIRMKVQDMNSKATVFYSKKKAPLVSNPDDEKWKAEFSFYLELDLSVFQEKTSGEKKTFTVPVTIGMILPLKPNDRGLGYAHLNQTTGECDFDSWAFARLQATIRGEIEN